MVLNFSSLKQWPRKNYNNLTYKSVLLRYKWVKIEVNFPILGKYALFRSSFN